ncbi:DUF3325 family protein [Stutzerimonas stutzeri]|uniref:DUF3325 family protein n=1 Tax=Stutzerimonas stutzeri TaxID=316 RepID=UPI001C2EE1E8|nr:DUF3325 family protein [Stutzerimonas stutzeri]
MPEWLGTLCAFALCYLAFALLALCQPAQRKRVDAQACPATAKGQWARKLCATLCLSAALLVLLDAQGGGFGTLLWLFLTSAAAMSVALTLSWAPAGLRLLLQAPCRSAR